MSTGFDIPLPKPWAWSLLKFSTTFLNRGTAPAYVDDGSVRTVSQAANQATGLDWKRTRFHDYHGDPRRLKGHLLPSDVLINSTGTGTLGRVGYFTGSPGNLPCVADGHITLARADRHIAEPRYIYYWLSSTLFYDYIYSSLIVGATNQIELSRERLAGAPVALPPLDEQRRIADFLDAETARVDQLRKATGQQLELLNCQRLEAFRTMTTGTNRKALKSDTNILWMPSMSRGWRLFKVGRSFLTGSGTTPRSSNHRFFDGPHPWINTGDLRDGTIPKPARTVSSAALQEYPTLRIYPSNTLMVAMYGATIGRIGISAIPACVNQACCALIPIGAIDTTYAFYWFLAHRTEILQLGSGGGQPNISQDLVRSLKISAPGSLTEQQAIATACSKIAEESKNHRSKLSQRSALLTERRQALITAAVTGQIDVTTARRGYATEGVAA